MTSKHIFPAVAPFAAAAVKLRSGFSPHLFVWYMRNTAGEQHHQRWTKHAGDTPESSAQTHQQQKLSDRFPPSSLNALFAFPFIYTAPYYPGARISSLGLEKHDHTDAWLGEGLLEQRSLHADIKNKLPEIRSGKLRVIHSSGSTMPGSIHSEVGVVRAAAALSRGGSHS